MNARLETLRRIERILDDIRFLEIALVKDYGFEEGRKTLIEVHLMHAKFLKLRAILQSITVQTSPPK